MIWLKVSFAAAILLFFAFVYLATTEDWKK
jgi:hypothetical protein